jgi:hypothetical protein
MKIYNKNDIIEKWKLYFGKNVKYRFYYSSTKDYMKTYLMKENLNYEYFFRIVNFFNPNYIKETNNKIILYWYLKKT